MISKETAICRIKTNADPIYSTFTFNDEYSKGYKAGIEDALYAIQKMPDETDWIQVSDRLPEVDGGYVNAIVCDTRGKVYHGTFKYKEGWISNHTINHRHLHNIVAWMPLPEPWKEEK